MLADSFNIDYLAGKLDPEIQRYPQPMVAEQAFLRLAREWLAKVKGIPKEDPLPRDADVLALSCLLLTVEWGTDFTPVAYDQMQISHQALSNRGILSWIDQLSWKICRASSFKPAHQSDGIGELTVNLNHHSSSIRWWMMRMAWFAVPWLSRVEVTDRLLSNLANTLAWPFEAAGLAARFFDNTNTFLSFARDYKPPELFEDQYRERLKLLEEFGILQVQAPLWRLECECRKAIEQTGLGFRTADG